eukprot:6011312-Pleurochrysis_carterae.AAC.1
MHAGTSHKIGLLKVLSAGHCGACTPESLRLPAVLLLRSSAISPTLGLTLKYVLSYSRTTQYIPVESICSKALGEFSQTFACGRASAAAERKEPESFTWTILHSQKWNKDVQNA